MGWEHRIGQVRSSKGENSILCYQLLAFLTWQLAWWSTESIARLVCDLRLFTLDLFCNSGSSVGFVFFIQAFTLLSFPWCSSSV